MKLLILGHEDRYAVEQLQLALFPLASMEQVEQPFAGDGAVSSLHRGAAWLTAVTVITLGGKTCRGVRRLKAGEETVSARRRILQQSYYIAALPFLEKAPAWGALSGVRPTKLTTRHLLAGGSAASAKRMMERDYFVTPERSLLAVETSQATVAATKLLRPEDVSLYVGIPFCPTRCAYCSFVSRTVGKNTRLLEPYLSVLEQEIRLTGKLLREAGRKVRSLYIGGGTPTTLSASQLQRLMEQLKESFDLSQCLEYTVEGGRPDTLDREKLEILHAMGADRMSINPQSMEDAVLRACGRPHTAQDVLEAYALAEQAGYKAINMDLIAGLPGDTPEGFRRSLDTVAALMPANITVHTLALKKGADLFESRSGLPTAEAVTQMVEYAGSTLRGLGYKPYYLYRQKYMSGSFENIGWSRDGLDCLYNICMMEELHTVISLGGGGATKVLMPDGTLRRFHNPKFPEQYIEGSILEQKQELFRLLKEGK